MTPDLFSYQDYRKFLRDWFRAENERRERAGKLPLTHRRFHELAGLSNQGTLLQILEHGRRLTVRLLNHFIIPIGVEAGSLEERYLRALIELEAAQKGYEEASERLEAEAQGEGEPRPARSKAKRTGVRESKRRDGAVSAKTRTVEEAREVLERAQAELRALRDLHRAQRIAGQLQEILRSLPTTVLLELARRADFQADPSWVAERLMLDVTEEQIVTALAALQAAGVLDADGRPAPIFTTDEGVPAFAVQGYYEAVHRASGDALRELFGPRRLAAQARQRVGALTVAIPAARVADFQKLLLRVQNEIAAFLQGLDGDPEVVYQLYLHLFPLSKP